MPRALTLALALLTLTPAVAHAARLEVYPREVTARPGDALRFVAVIYTGPAGKELARVPPQLGWSAKPLEMADGVLHIPTEGAPTELEVKATVGALSATARVRVRYQDLELLPAQARVYMGDTLQLTALDTQGGGARTPAQAEWSADRGKVDVLGRYTAPATPGPDTVRIKVGQRVAVAQVLVVAERASEAPTPAETPAPSPPAVVPLKIRTWSRSGGTMSKHRVEVEVLSPKAAHIKLLGRGRTGTVSSLASRRVQPGEIVVLEANVSTSIREVELQLLDAEGAVISHQRQLR
ncbi:MAG: hypothetical protein AB7N76_18935 [Planctomycetota bacterium]